MYSKGYKSAISSCNLEDRQDVLCDFSTYLLSLKTVDGIPLHRSRKKTFIVGFLATSTSILELSHLLLGSYHYILTIRFSQDHIECLFSKIRRMGGYNNNPSSLQFKAALKRLLCKQSIQSSQAANSLDCESTSSVFKLEWSKRRSPLQTDEQQLDEGDCTILDELKIDEHPMHDNILYYIAGYIVKSLKGTVTCEACCDALIDVQDKSVDHGYAEPLCHAYQKLTSVKNRGGLVLASQPVYRIVKRCELVFRETVVADPAKYATRKSLIQFLVAAFRYSSTEDRPLTTFSHVCDIEQGLLPHTSQLTNKIVEKYFTMRTKYFSKLYNRMVKRKNFGSDRSRLSRLVIFKNQ